MAQRESKVQTKTFVEIIGRDASKKGRLELTPGNLHYYRPNAREDSPTLSMTYQQLTALLEREVELQEIDASKPFSLRSRMEKDFLFEYEWCPPHGIPEFHEDWSGFHSSSSLGKLDPRRVDDGAYQLSQDMQNGKKSKRTRWYAQISVPLALWIVARYIEKFLVGTRDRTTPTKNVVITHPEMRVALRTLLKKLD